ncbi:MAG: trypsin-like serine protease, partial [Deltaproteobacteria bacterium]|nr:trypsin-like serine protease [Deltaproteobacteria bacterium]
VLTAGHCLCFEEETEEGEEPGPCTLAQPDEVSLFLPHRGWHPVSEVILHPNYDSRGADLAVLKLAEPVLGIAPLAIAQEPPDAGTMMTIVGFGRNDGLNGYEVGVKRVGSVPTVGCTGDESNIVHQCFESADYTCDGDSGGPSLEGTGPNAQISGIVSYGYDGPGPQSGDLGNCTGRSVNVQVATFAAWIEGQAGVDLGTDSCGTFAPVGDGALAQTESAALVEDGVLEVSMDVPKGTSELRLTWNGHLGYMDGNMLRAVDTYMSLTEGRPEGNDEIIFNVCSGDGSECLNSSPKSGTWTARLTMTRGAGDYQLTLSAFGDAPIAEPDNYNVVEDSFIQISAADGVLRNDSASSRGGTARLMSEPINGQVALRGDGSFDYQPSEDFVGTDTFTYRYDDGEYTSEDTTVSINVGNAQGGCACRASSQRAGDWWLLSLVALALWRRRRRR